MVTYESLIAYTVMLATIIKIVFDENLITDIRHAHFWTPPFMAAFQPHSQPYRKSCSLTAATYSSCTQMKSTHKIRQTYAKRLYASGVPLEHIRKELGHQNLTTTEKYIFNPFTEKETYELMAQAV